MIDDVRITSYGCTGNPNSFKIGACVSSLVAIASNAAGAASSPLTPQLPQYQSFRVSFTWNRITQSPEGARCSCPTRWTYCIHIEATLYHLSLSTVPLVLRSAVLTDVGASANIGQSPYFVGALREGLMKSMWRHERVGLSLRRIVMIGKGGSLPLQSPHCFDTPDDDFRGVCLVLLPTDCSGGEVLCQQQDENERMIFRGGPYHPFKASCNSRSRPSLHFVALHRDCQFEVQPVINGERIMLEFSILSVDNACNELTEMRSSSSYSTKSVMLSPSRAISSPKQLIPHNLHLLGVIHVQRASDHHQRTKFMVLNELVKQLYSSQSSSKMFGALTPCTEIAHGLRLTRLDLSSRMISDHLQRFNIPVSLVAVLNECSHHATEDKLTSELSSPLSVKDDRVVKEIYHSVVSLINEKFDNRLDVQRDIALGDDRNIPFFSPWSNSKDSIVVENPQLCTAPNEASRCVKLQTALLIGPIPVVDELYDICLERGCSLFDHSRSSDDIDLGNYPQVDDLDGVLSPSIFASTQRSKRRVLMVSAATVAKQTQQSEGRAIGSSSSSVRSTMDNSTHSTMSKVQQAAATRPSMVRRGSLSNSLVMPVASTKATRLSVLGTNTIDKAEASQSTTQVPTFRHAANLRSSIVRSTSIHCESTNQTAAVGGGMKIAMPKSPPTFVVQKTNPQKLQPKTAT